MNHIELTFDITTIEFNGFIVQSFSFLANKLALNNYSSSFTANILSARDKILSI